MALYLALCFPPLYHTLRYTVDALLDGEGAPPPPYFAVLRRMLITLALTVRPGPRPVLRWRNPRLERLPMPRCALGDRRIRS